MMDARNIESLTERGEFYLCLARAFMTPLQPDSFAAMRDALADDLAELGESLGYDCAAHIAAYRDAINATPQHLALLQCYSALFLTPPRPVAINAASYLDGAHGGGTVTALEQTYRRCGLQRGTDFHDLADHVAVQLEFVAWLYFTGAEAMSAGTALPAVRPEHFLHGFVTRWLPRFIEDLAQEAARPEAPANPYLALARMLAAAVSQDAVAEEIAPTELRARMAIDKARHTRAERGVTAKDMELIARKLREKGLSTEHLAIPPELRDEVQGYSRGTPPGPRRGLCDGS